MKSNALFILTALVSLTASATEPASTPTPAAAVQAPSASTSAAAVAPAAAPTAAAAAAPVAGAAAPATDLAAATQLTDEQRAALTKWARNQGYKPTQKAHGTWWCKNEATLGERIPRTKCASEETLGEMQRSSLANQETMGEKMRLCSGNGCISN